MRGKVSIITCDHDSICEEWEIDHYETSASTVGGVRITATERAPGWSCGLEDYCPEHAPTTEPTTRREVAASTKESTT